MKGNKRGISLIVLVITIILIIIIAGAIILSLNGSGIISRAHKAVDSFNEGAEIERLQVILSSAYKENMLTEESIKEAVDKEFGTNTSKVKMFEDGEITIFVPSNKKEYYVDNNGKISVTKVENVMDTAGFSGSGTEANPYQISSIEDLILLAINVNNGGTQNYKNKFFELTRDLDFRLISSYIEYDKIVDEENNIDLITSMITGEGFTPIGDSSHEFSATFDGKEHKIKNLYESRTGNVALFGNAADNSWQAVPSIKNLTLNNVYLKTSTENAGGLCMGRCWVTNCHIDGTIISETGQASGFEGAMRGLRNSSINATIKGKKHTAGLFSSISGSVRIENCVIKGSIEGRDAGGIAGYNYRTIRSDS